MPSYTELFAVSLWPVSNKPNSAPSGKKAKTPVIEDNYEQILAWYVNQSTIDNHIQQNVTNFQFMYLGEGVFQLEYTAENDESAAFIGLDDPGNCRLTIDDKEYTVSWLPLQAATERFAVYLDDCEDEVKEIVDAKHHVDALLKWYANQVKDDYTRYYAFNIKFTHIADNVFELNCVIDGTMIDTRMLVQPDDDGNHPLKIGNREFLVCVSGV